MRVARFPVTRDRNPYQRLLYEHLEAEGVRLVGDGALDPRWLEGHAGEVDLLHVHWRPDRLLDDVDPFGPPSPVAGDAVRPSAARLAEHLELARSLGFVLAWTVHEIAQLGGDAPTLEHLAAVELGSRADVVLTHNEVATATVVELGLAPADRVRTIPLGHYGDAHPDTGTVTRAELGIDDGATVFLAFGHQRADKSLDLLLEAQAQVDRDDLVVVVAGHTDPWLDLEHHPAAKADPAHVIVLGSIPDDQVVALHRLADATVLPRGYEWTPSSLVLSLSHGCSVVAANLASVSEHGGPGVFTFRPGDVDDLAATLERVADDPIERQIRGQAGRAFVRSTTWSETAAATAAAFRQALGAPRATS